MSTVRKKTCSTACAFERARRMRRAKESRHKARRYARRQRVCRGCGVNVAKSKQFCGACRPPRPSRGSRKERKPYVYQPRPRLCRGCGTDIPHPLQYCSECRPVAKVRSLHQNLQYSRDRKTKMGAAVYVFKRLTGKQERVVAKRERYQTRCLVCGIIVSRPKNTICSETCRRARELERLEARKHGEVLLRPVLPPVNVRKKDWGKRRLQRLKESDPDSYQYAKRQKRGDHIKERHRRRLRDNDSSAIYMAFRQLNLMPPKEDKHHDDD